ncbi:MAG: GTPase ObgE [Negativicutes bacterium]|nr:GTPase ObgE [Negativicutes bacterium]
MFVDRAKISVAAGNGGSGMSSFRREKFVPRGGPDGGDGGRGGNVYVRADKNINTLIDFRYRRKFKAGNGRNGQPATKTGGDGQDCEIAVPVGTMVFDADTDQLIADLVSDQQTALVARGGRGGRGNARFVSSTHRAPTLSEHGEPGESRELLLELKLLADVGLIGFPNVGKSSILARLTAARPEIADYHFTTLTPVLGVVSLGDGNSFVIADIPGLIEGAHTGRGLGFEFLRHIERTRVLVHVVDASGSEGRDPADDIVTIGNELQSYSRDLASRPQIIAANKSDLSVDQEIRARIIERSYKIGAECYFVSAATGFGMAELVAAIWRKLTELPVDEPVVVHASVAERQDRNEPATVITRNESGHFVVSNSRLEKLVFMTKFTDDEGWRRFQQIWQSMDIERELNARGIREGDIVVIAGREFEYRQQAAKNVD